VSQAVRALDPATARRVRLLALDVDGVLTDNAVFVGMVSGTAAEFKRFDIQDGLGMSILRRRGILLAWVSGRFSEATELRARELDVRELVQDSSARKVPAMEALLERHALKWDEVAFVGDDLADLPVLRRVGVPIAVANAVPEVKALAAFVTAARGGQGAVREVIETLLRARGEWEAGVRQYLEDRGEDAGYLATR
jgi:3-deoxy-D-manno-octulosonate 8-phosphate phosphatase (KDO 8-P phosphatase)